MAGPSVAAGAGLVSSAKVSVFLPPPGAWCLARTLQHNTYLDI